MNVVLMPPIQAPAGSSRSASLKLPNQFTCFTGTKVQILMLLFFHAAAPRELADINCVPQKMTISQAETGESLGNTVSLENTLQMSLDSLEDILQMSGVEQ
jgi:hypothetical protein